jgi:hypothetical protein
VSRSLIQYPWPQGVELLAADQCCITKNTFINSGTLEVAGSVPLVPGSAIFSGVLLSDSGAVDVAANSKLNLQTAPSTLASGASFTGAGRTIVEHLATITMQGSATLDPTSTFEVDTSGTLTGNAASFNGGNVAWNGGSFAGTIAITAPTCCGVFKNLGAFSNDPGAGERHHHVRHQLHEQWHRRAEER